MCRWTYAPLGTLLNASLTALSKHEPTRAHGLVDARLPAGPAASVITGEDHTADVSAASCGGHVLGSGDRLGVVAGIRRTAEQAVGEQVDDRGQIELALAWAPRRPQHGEGERDRVRHRRAPARLSSVRCGWRARRGSVRSPTVGRRTVRFDCRPRRCRRRARTGPEATKVAISRCTPGAIGGVRVTGALPEHRRCAAWPRWRPPATSCSRSCRPSAVTAAWPRRAVWPPAAP